MVKGEIKPQSSVKEAEDKGYHGYSSSNRDKEHPSFSSAAIDDLCLD
jgi:hypothetical protein